MCGRFVIEDKKDSLPKRFNVMKNSWYKASTYGTSYNIAPGFIVPVVTKNNQDNYNELELMKWGLIPFWAKDPNIGFKLINARSDSLAQKASFKESFKKRRCLIPATAFYEWKKSEDSKNKIPYLFKLKSDEIFSFAGLFDSWKDAEGKEIKTFTIITTDANEIMKDVHSRMPVILNKSEEDVWLDKNAPMDGLETILNPFPSDEMESYLVSQEVNSPKNQGSNLIEKLENKL